MIEVKNVIRLFLSGHEHQSLLVKGDWGTGKTHITREALQDWEKESPNQNRWVQVSLYGMKSVAEVDAALAVAAAQKLTGKKSVSKLAKHIGPLLGHLDAAGVVGHVAKELGKSHLLWLDDIERKHPTLTLSDVVAFVDVFMNTHGGKVLCVVNTDRLSEEERGWLQLNGEKTFPRRIKLEPTAEYVAEVLEVTGDDTNDVALEFIKSQSVSNIRIAREILANAREFQNVLEPNESEKALVAEGTITVCVATAATAGLKDFPPCSFLTGPMTSLLPKEESLTDEERLWKDLLARSNYIRTDNFDREIISQVERGYFAAPALRSIMAERRDGSETELNAAWNEYHRSLKGDTEQFAKKFYDAALASVLSTSMNNMNSSIRLLRLLDKPDLADELGKSYVDSRLNGPPRALDMGQDHFLEAKDRDEGFEKQLKAGLEARIKSLGLRSTLRAGAKDSYLDEYQSERLANVDAEELSKAFLELEEDDLQNRAIKACLEHAKYNDSESAKKVRAVTEQALKKIAAGSKLNQVRIERKYGVKV